MKNLILLATVLLLSPLAEARRPLVEIATSQGVRHSALEEKRTSEGKIAFIKGRMQTASCVDAEGEQTCRKAAALRLMPTLWEAWEVSARDRTELKVLEVIETADGMSAVKVSQIVNGIPVDGGGLSLLLDREGDIITVVGELVPYTAKTKPSRNKGFAAAARALNPHRPSWMDDVSPVSFAGAHGQTRLQVQDGDLTQAVDAKTGKTLWHFEGWEKRAVVSETGEVLSESFGDASNKPAKTPHRILGDASSNANWDNLDVSTITYDDTTWVGYNYNYITLQCEYQARYDSSIYGVNRVDDLAFSDASYTGSCSGTPTVSTYTSMTWSDVREWDMLYWVKKMRIWAKANVHNHVGGATVLNTVNVEVGASSSATCGSVGTAWCGCAHLGKISFKGTATNTNPGCYSTNTIGHEYGHLMHSMYGYGGNTSCADTLTRQWFAESFGNIMMVEMGFGGTSYTDTGALYHMNSGAQGPALRHKHDVSAYIYTGSCTANYHKLMQPMWEFIWDVNCDTSTNYNYYCPNTAPESMDVFGVAPSTLRLYAARGLGFSALLSPPNWGTYHLSSAVANWKVYVSGKVPSGTSARLTEIFAHHGL